jgi:hypothetical protein
MKSQYKGHCQACANVQAVKPNGTIAKHGYTVKHGFFMGICMGSGELPLEVSNEFTFKVINSINKQIPQLLTLADRLNEGLEIPNQITLGSGNRSKTISINDAKDYEIKKYCSAESAKNKHKAYCGELTIKMLTNANLEFYGKELNFIG